MAYSTNPIAGIDFTQTVAGTGTSFDEGNDFPLGMQVTSQDGQVYLYVHAAGAISQYDFVTIDEDFEAIAATQAAVNDGHRVGVAQVAISDNDFAWVAVAGSNMNGNVLSSCAADVELYATSTAGKLDDAGTVGHLVKGVVCVAANNTATFGAVELIASYPRSGTPGGATS